MSVVSVNVKGTTSCQLQAGGNRSYEVLYVVVTNDPDDQPPTVISSVGIPSLGESYAIGNSFDRGAFVRGYAAELESQEDDRKVWRVTVTFTTLPNDTDAPELGLQYDYPWLKPARINSYGVNQEIQVQGTYADPSTGAAAVWLKNGAGGQIDDLYLPSSTPSLSIEKDFVDIDPTADFNDYSDTVNESTFFGWGQDYWRLTYPRWQQLYTGDGIRYFNVVFEFEWRNKWNGITWTNEGYYYKDGSSYYRTADSRGAPLPGKGLLSSAGAQVWTRESITVNAYLRKDFADLGIPTGI